MIKWILTNKDWLFSGIGVVLLGFFYKKASLIMKGWKKGELVIAKGLCGDYYLYFPRPHSPNKFVRCPLHIKKSFRQNHFNVKLKIREINFHGYIKVIDGALFMKVKGSIAESYQVYYFIRDIGKSSLLKGVEIARTRKREPLVCRVAAKKTTHEFADQQTEFLDDSELPISIKKVINTSPNIMYQLI